ncbi:MAG: AraC family transcriptional regulator, partial [Candidatus Paceibacterota bacterium]
MKLYIKYMVSLRCKMFVRDELQKLGVNYDSVDLGIVEVHDDITDEQIEAFAKNIKKGGLELLD